jgi:nucleolin
VQKRPRAASNVSAASSQKNKAKKTTENQKVPQKKQKVQDSSSDDDSSSSEEPKVIAKKAPAAPAKKPAKKQSSSSSDDSSSESEKPAPKKAAPAKKAPAKKESSSDDDSSSESEKAKPVRKNSAASGKNAKNAKKDSSSDSDSSESEKPAAKKAPAKKAAAKKESSSSSSDEEEEAPAKKTSRKASAQHQAPADDGNDGKTELFVTGLSFDTTEDTLRPFFEEHGELVKCKLVMAGGRSKGKAFIEYADNATARAALSATNEQTLDGRTIYVEFSGQAAGGTRNDGEVNTVFVGNLSFRIDRSTIENHFASCGTITDVRIAQDENGRSRGFAHVEFSSNAEALEAMKLAGSMLEGREIRLDLS